MAVKISPFKSMLFNYKGKPQSFRMERHGFVKTLGWSSGELNLIPAFATGFFKVSPLISLCLSLPVCAMKTKTVQVPDPSSPLYKRCCLCDGSQSYLRVFIIVGHKGIFLLEGKSSWSRLSFFNASLSPWINVVLYWFKVRQSLCREDLQKLNLLDHSIHLIDYPHLYLVEQNGSLRS